MASGECRSLFPATMPAGAGYAIIDNWTTASAAYSVAARSIARPCTGGFRRALAPIDAAGSISSRSAFESSLLWSRCAGLPELNGRLAARCHRSCARWRNGQISNRARSIDRKTVRKYIESGLEARPNAPSGQRTDITDGYRLGVFGPRQGDRLTTYAARTSMFRTGKTSPGLERKAL